MPKSPTESNYARQLKNALHARFGKGVLIHKVHGGPYQEAGVSDLLLCLHGRWVAIELKRPGEKVTPLQDAFLRRVSEAGGLGLIVYTNWEPIEVIDKWLS